MRLLALSLILLATAGATANAQTNDTNNPNATSIGGWQSCADPAHRRSAEQEIAACTRVLDNTHAELWRGTAFWWRGVAQKRAGAPDRATEDFSASLAAYSHYIEATPHSAEAHFQRAQLFAYLQRYDDALREYNSGDGIAPNQAVSYYGRGNVAFARGDYGTAIRAFDAARRTTRLNSSAGELHMTDGAYSRRFIGQSFDSLRCAARAASGVELNFAAQICDQAVRDSNSDADALVARGFLRFKQGQFGPALADFSRAATSRLDFAPALLGRGVLRLRAGDAGGAADIARAHALDAAAAATYERAGMRAP